MSKQIDEKVVSLEFDNGNFEKNVKTSMSTLDKLKAKLDFSGASKGIEEIEHAADKCDFTNMKNGIHSLSLSFDALGVVAYKVLTNITDAAYNAGVNLVKSMSGIDLVAQGWNKYAEQTTAIQTIMSAVGEKVKDEVTGETYALKDVNEVVDKLGWYAGETSYSLEQMTSALGSFTSSGVDLKVAEGTLMGIANACADAGVNSSLASHAFIGFSKAIGQGNVTLNLWNNQLKTSGITNSEKFKQKLLDAAEAAGYLKQTMDGVYKTTAKTEKKGETVTIADFTSALTDSKWLKTDVLLKTFNEYGNLVDSVYNLYENGTINLASEELSDFTAAMEEQGKTLKDLGLDKEFSTTSKAIGALTKAYETLGLEVPTSLSSFKRAQEAITYQQAIDSVKGAVSAGWAETFKLIFGDLEEASKIWTTLANDLYDVFALGGETRNTILEQTFGSKWGEFGDVLNEYGMSLKDFEERFGKFAEEHDTNISEIIREYGSLEKAMSGGVFGSEQLLKFFESQSDEFKDLADAAKDAKSPVSELIQIITKPTGRELLADSIHNILQAVIDLKATVGEAWSEVFPEKDMGDLLYIIIKKFNEFTKKVTDTTSKLGWLKNILEGAFTVLKLFGNIISQIVKGGLSILNAVFGDLEINVDDFSNTLGESLKKFADWIEENNVIFNVLNNIANKLSEITNNISVWVNDLKEIDAVKNTFKGLKEFFNSFTIDLSKITISLDNLSNPIENFADVFKNAIIPVKVTADELGNNVSNAVETVGNKFDEYLPVMQSFIETLIGLGSGYLVLTGLKKITEGLYNLTKPLYSVSEFLSSWGGVGNAIKGYFTALTKSVKTDQFLKIAAAIAILAGSLWLLAKLDSDALWDAIGALAALSLILVVFSASMKAINPNGLSVNITGLASTLFALAASLVLISIAIKSISKVDNLFESWITVISMLAALVIACKIIAKDYADISKSSGIILSFAASLLIIAIAFKSLSNIDPERIGPAIIALGSALLALLAVAAIMQKFSGSKEAGLQILLIAVSLYAIIKSIEKLASLPAETYVKGLLALLPIFAGYLIVAAAVKSAGIESYKTSLYVLAIASSLVFIAKAVSMFGDMNISTLIKGGIAVATLGLVMAAIVKTMGGIEVKGSFAQLAGLAIVILTLSASLYVMAGAMLLFKNMDLAGLAKGVGAISILLLSMGTAIKLMGKAAFDKNSISTVIAMIVAVAVLAGAVLLLSSIETEKLLYSAGAIIAMIATLSLLAFALGSIKTVKTANLITVFAGLIILVAGATAIIYALSQIQNVEGTARLATSLCQMLLSFAISAVALSLAAMLLPSGSEAAILKLVAIIGVISAVIVAIGYLLNESDYIVNNIDAVSELLNKIGTAIGGFIGGIIGGTIGGIVSGFAREIEEVGTSLSNFAKNIEGFLTLSVPAGFDNTIKSLTTIITSFGSLEVITAISRLTSNKNVGEDLKTFFTNYANAILAFSDSFEGKKINYAAMNTAANAAGKLAELNDSLPKEGGVVQWWSGTSNIGTFGDNLKTFAQGIVDMCNKLTEAGDINRSGGPIDVALTAAEALNQFQTTIGTKSGGIVQKILGGSDLGSFGTSIRQFAIGLYDFCMILIGGTDSEGISWTGIDLTKLNSDNGPVKAAKIAGETLKSLNEGLPEGFSLSSFIFGSQGNLGTFGTQLRTFASGIVDFTAILSGGTDSKGKEWSGIQTTGDVSNLTKSVEDTAYVIKSLSGLANSLPDDTGLFGTSKNIGTFGTQLGTMSVGISNFSKNLDGIVIPETTTIDRIKEIISSMLDLAVFSEEGLFTDKLGNLSELGLYIEYFGNHLRNFINAINGYSIDLVDAILGDINEFLGMGNIFGSLSITIEDETQTIWTLLATKITSIANDCKTRITNFINDIIVLLNAHFRAYEAGKQTLEGLRNGLTDEDLLSQIYQAGVDAGNTFMAGYNATVKVASPSKEMERSGKFTVEGLIKGVVSKLSDLNDTGKAAGNVLMSSIQNSIELANEVTNDLNPVITPVLDLSQVQEESGKINGLFANTSLNGVRSINALNQNGGNLAGEVNNNVSINVDFSVNNAGRDLTESDINRFGSMIADRVNRELGLLM